LKYQLAGVKKVQKILWENATTLNLFVPDPADQAKVKSLFECFSSLDGESDCALSRVAMALKRPEDFVLKPQREGGGNNYFRQQISVTRTPKPSPMLTSLLHSELRSFADHRTTG
jgi:glutathione synthase